MPVAEIIRGRPKWQIREKGYADAYKGGRRPVTLIGVNFSAKKRNIDEPLIESL